MTYLVGSHRLDARAWEGAGTLARPRARSDLSIARRPSPRRVPGRSSELDEPFPEARVAPRARTVADRRALIDRLSRYDDLDMAWFLAEDAVPARPDARSARLDLVGRPIAARSSTTDRATW